MAINETKINFVKSFVNYCKKMHKDRINKIVIFGESVDPSIKNPKCLDFAVGLVNADDYNNYELLGELLSYIGDIVDDGECNLVPISDKVLRKSTLDIINKGEVVYETR